MRMKRWEHYSHPADVGIRGFGETVEQSFAHAALALTAIITEPEKVEPKSKVEIECNETGLDLLFAAWLNALLFEMTAHNMLFSKFEITFTGNKLLAEAYGEKLNLKKHNPAVEVKAATYTDLKVQKNKAGLWTAQCIIDV